MRQLRIAAVSTLSLLLVGCGPSGDRPYAEGDTPRSSPNATPTQDARADSTAGVARSSGQPGVAGDTVGRSSKISPPGGKAP